MAGFVDVVLVGPGDDKIRVIEALRDVTCDEPALTMLDLRAAKRLTDTAPCVALPNVRSDVRQGQGSPRVGRRDGRAPAVLRAEMFHEFRSRSPRGWPS